MTQLSHVTESVPWLVFFSYLLAFFKGFDRNFEKVKVNLCQKYILLVCQMLIGQVTLGEKEPKTVSH